MLGTHLMSFLFSFSSNPCIFQFTLIVLCISGGIVVFTSYSYANFIYCECNIPSQLFFLECCSFSTSELLFLMCGTVGVPLFSARTEIYLRKLEINLYILSRKIS